MGFAAENQVRTGLPAGGKWIRTIGPRPRSSSIRAMRAEIVGRSTDVFRRDREFDVSALQGRLSTSSQSQCSTAPGLIAGTWIDHFSYAGPMVRIRFPPARSLVSPVPSADADPLSLASSLRARLLVKPDRPEILIEEMARTDLPALDIGTVGHDPVPPQGHDLVPLVVQRMLLELAHQLALLCRIGLVQHPLIKID